jgi:hypothetical protein
MKEELVAMLGNERLDELARLVREIDPMDAGCHSINLSLDQKKPMGFGS